MEHLGSLTSLRKQQLISEFTGLKQACPEGIFVSLTPGDPTLWSAVLFVRHGPYASAILRFQICFPEVYPDLPPIILFSTDIFHPLISPLTTYTYTTNTQDSGMVSATDEERLPPGGFSLRHGFPQWFRRGKRLVTGSENADGEREMISSSDWASAHSKTSTDAGGSRGVNASSYLQTGSTGVSTYKILKYIKSTFDSHEVLDSIPLAAAGNPGAWHAWRTHQRKQGELSDEQRRDDKQVLGFDRQESSQRMTVTDDVSLPDQAMRQPGHWNWDGVWEDRVKKGIAASLSEAVLYGASGASDEIIQFLPMEEADIESVKHDIHRTVKNSP